MIPQLQTLKTGWHNNCCYNSNKNVTFSLMSIYTKKCTCIYGLFRKLSTLKTGWPNFCCDSINCLSHDDPQKTNVHNCCVLTTASQKSSKSGIISRIGKWKNFTLIIIQYAPSSSSSLFYVFKILNSMIKECNLTDANFLYAQKTHMKIYSCSEVLNLQCS
jgi:hypothetical protein